MPEPIPVVVDNDAPGSVPTPSPAAPAPTPVVETPAAQAPVAPVTPAEPVKPAEGTVTPAVPATPELVELPDGRKVDAATAGKEYRSLLADHTRKSQELARLTRQPAPVDPNAPITQPAKKAWEDPNWQPTTYQEVLDAAADKIKTDAERQADLKKAEDTHLASTVDAMITEIKKTDPTLNESELYKHAHKYGFGINLKGAYQNMKDFNESIKKAQTITANNITKRNADPVAGGSHSVGVIPDGDIYDPNARNTSLVDALRAVK